MVKEDWALTHLEMPNTDRGPSKLWGSLEIREFVCHQLPVLRYIPESNPNKMGLFPELS